MSDDELHEDVPLVAKQEALSLRRIVSDLSRQVKKLEDRLSVSENKVRVMESVIAGMKENGGHMEAPLRRSPELAKAIMKELRKELRHTYMVNERGEQIGNRSLFAVAKSWAAKRLEEGMPASKVFPNLTRCYWLDARADAGMDEEMDDSDCEEDSPEEERFKAVIRKVLSAAGRGRLLLKEDIEYCCYRLVDSWASMARKQQKRKASNQADLAHYHDMERPNKKHHPDDGLAHMDVSED